MGLFLQKTNGDDKENLCSFLKHVCSEPWTQQLREQNLSVSVRSMVSFFLTFEIRESPTAPSGWPQCFQLICHSQEEEEEETQLLLEEMLLCCAPCSSSRNIKIFLYFLAQPQLKWDVILYESQAAEPIPGSQILEIRENVSHFPGKTQWIWEKKN